MKKVMWRIVPLILLACLMAYVDRVNISFASLQMNDELKFSASIYGLGAGLFFLAYALFEVPSSLMLRRYSAPQWIARIMITWGLLAAGMMFVRTPMQFYIVRFLLGAAEAGFFPSVICYFSGWFPPAWRGRALSRIYIASSLASVVTGGISARLLCCLLEPALICMLLGFTLGPIGSAVVAGAQALLILYVRTRIASDRRTREHVASTALAINIP